MDRLSDLEKERALTRAALTNKLDALEERVRTSIEEARETVKRTVDLQYQVEKRPLVILGCSALLGYVLGRVWFTGSRPGELGSEDGTEGHEGRTPSNGESRTQAGVLKGALSAVLSNLLVDLVKEIVPLGTAARDDTAESAPRAPDGEQQAGE